MLTALLVFTGLIAIYQVDLLSRFSLMRMGAKRHVTRCSSLYRQTWVSLNKQQEAFEKCWAHSPQRAASRQFTRCR